MSSKSTTPLNGSKNSNDQHQAPYPRTMVVDQIQADRAKSPEIKTSHQSHEGTTEVSSRRQSNARQESCMPVDRAWVSASQGASNPGGSRGHSPMSVWEHASPRDGSWDAIGEVCSRAASGQGSAKSPSSKNRKPDNTTVLAIKGSSRGGE